MIKHNNPDEIILNHKQVHSETNVHDTIQYQIELLNDLARSDMDKAFSFALLKIEYLENLLKLFGEIITEEKKWLDVNDTAFEKIVELCKMADFNKTKEINPEEIMGIINRRNEEKKC